MNSILFATGNNEKLELAQSICGPLGIQLIQFDTETPEIQSEDPKEVLLHKTEQKFALANGKPILVSDDSWDIPGLNGFPGPYMKSMDHWFTPQNFIDLTKNLSDRTINLHQYLAYQDEQGVQVFHSIVKGTLCKSAKGDYGHPAQKIITLDRDNGLTISEVYDKGLHHKTDRFNNTHDAWHQFVQWYKTNKTTE